VDENNDDDVDCLCNCCGATVAVKAETDGDDERTIIMVARVAACDRAVN
jgi:hypothetical protein